MVSMIKSIAVKESNFNVLPRVVEAGVKSKIKIIPVGNKFAFDDSAYVVKFVPMELSSKTNILTDLDTVKKNKCYNTYDIQRVVPIDGCIELEYTFTYEQEWILKIFPEDNGNCVMKFHIYSLEKDLFERYPYMGDFHSHSCCSDGSEEPAVVAANYRKAGFDVMALTDHHVHSSSVEMIEAYKDVPIDIKLLKGEEVHINEMGGYMHTVNLGGKKSVTDYFSENPDKCKAEISELKKTLDVPDGVNSYECAFRTWIADRIHEFGGFAIIPHPYWVTRDEYNMRPTIVKWLLENKKYDALEVVSGQNVEENCLQASLYNELRAEGIRVPIVGSSDSHGTDPACYFKMGKTVLFAKGELNFESVKESISELYTVGLEYQNNESVRISGPYRMVKYAQFLLKYYFPVHDDLCVEEGIAMKNYFNKVMGAKEMLEAVHGRTEKFRKEFYKR